MRAFVAALAIASASASSEVDVDLIQELSRQQHQQLRDVRASSKSVTAYTKLGPVTGFSGGGMNYFLGVPFAQPPVGDLRWKAPLPARAWTSWDATWYQPSCVQNGKSWTFESGQSEDCLYLNVYAPANISTPLPVMVWIYGGSYTYGSGSSPLYLGSNIAGYAGDVIVVTINYRLNVFGFLAGEALLAESPDKSVGNYGFQDQQMALAWVQQNIASFGGNPGQVTIFGESAGGASTSLHLLSDVSKPLFQRAIVESGAWSVWTASPYNISSLRLPELAANAKCTGTGAQVLACLRALDSSTIHGLTGGLTSGVLEWAPTIDGVVVVEDPRLSVAQGKVQNKPILVGFNLDEGTLFNGAPLQLNETEYVSWLSDYVGQYATAAAQLYPPSKFKSAWWALSTALRDAVFLCASQNDASDIIATTGNTQIYMYFYTHLLELIKIVDMFKKVPLGVCHGSEVIAVFRQTLALLTEGERLMSDMMVRYWTRFAVTGDPNGGTDTTWAPFSENDSVLQIDATSSAANMTLLEGGLFPEQCTYWRSVPLPFSRIFGGPQADKY